MMIPLTIPHPIYRFLTPCIVMSGTKQAVGAIDPRSTTTDSVKPLIIQAPDNTCGYIDGKKGKHLST